MNEFVIPFFGLKLGIHRYEFDIDSSFFASFENPLIDQGHFEVALELEKATNMLILRFSSSGSVDDYCDRCGDPLSVQCKAEDEVIVKFGEETIMEGDEIVVLSYDTHDINVAQLIYEMLVLHLPRKKVHARLEDCNQEVLAQLERAKKEAASKKEADPRWDALNKLK
jgi:uncharacterized metal-binding protein YceD (DUF177 family)